MKRKKVSGDPGPGYKKGTGRTHVSVGGRRRSGTLPSGAHYDVMTTRGAGGRVTDSQVIGKQGVYMRLQNPKNHISGVQKREEFMPRSRSKKSWERKTVLNDGSVRREREKKKK